jgi:hypothetical protein
MILFLILSVVVVTCDEEVNKKLYEMYGSPISEKTRTEANILFDYAVNASFETTCGEFAAGYARLEGIECISLDGVSSCNGEKENAVMISVLNSSKAVQFGSSVSTEIAACTIYQQNVLVVGYSDSIFVARLSLDLNIIDFIQFGANNVPKDAVYVDNDLWVLSESNTGTSDCAQDFECGDQDLLVVILDIISFNISKSVRIGTPGIESAVAITSDSQGGVVVVGNTIRSDSSFGDCDPSMTCTGSSGNDIILARLSLTGNVMWATQFGSDTSDVPSSMLIHDDLILVASTSTSSSSSSSVTWYSAAETVTCLQKNEECNFNSSRILLFHVEIQTGYLATQDTSLIFSSSSIQDPILDSSLPQVMMYDERGEIEGIYLVFSGDVKDITCVHPAQQCGGGGVDAHLTRIEFENSLISNIRYVLRIGTSNEDRIRDVVSFSNDTIVLSGFAITRDVMCDENMLCEDIEIDHHELTAGIILSLSDQRCSPGYAALPGFGCVQCPENTYSPFGGKCLDCPNGATCRDLSPQPFGGSVLKGSVFPSAQPEFRRDLFDMMSAHDLLNFETYEFQLCHRTRDGFMPCGEVAPNHVIYEDSELVREIESDDDSENLLLYTLLNSLDTECIAPYQNGSTTALLCTQCESTHAFIDGTCQTCDILESGIVANLVFANFNIIILSFVIVRCCLKVYIFRAQRGRSKVVQEDSCSDDHSNAEDKSGALREFANGMLQDSVGDEKEEEEERGASGDRRRSRSNSSKRRRSRSTSSAKKFPSKSKSRSGMSLLRIMSGSTTNDDYDEDDGLDYLQEGDEFGNHHSSSSSSDSDYEDVEIEAIQTKEEKIVEALLNVKTSWDERNNFVQYIRDRTHNVTRALKRHDEREYRRQDQILTIGYIKIIWGFMQTVYSLVHIFRVRWPSLLWRLFQTFGFTDLHVAILDGLKCILTTSIDTAEIYALIFLVPVRV